MLRWDVAESTSSMDSSKISAKEIENVIDRLKNEQHQGSTKRSYRSVWKNFNKFLIQLDVKPSSWESRLLLFVGHLVNTKKQSSTVRSYILAIKAILNLSGIELNPDQYLLTALTKACRMVNDSVKTRLPIKKRLLARMICQIEANWHDQQYLKVMYSALISTAYFGLFRVGELTLSPHVVKALDVQIGTNKKKIMFLLRSSKTHHKGVMPQKIKISSTEQQQKQITNKQTKKCDGFCPYDLLRNYLRVRPKIKSLDEQFFVHADSHPVTAANMRVTMKRILCSMNYDDSLFSMHSYRIGRAVDLMRLGLTVETIKELGRWKSNAVFGYLKNL